jgi:beta-lactamase regulating signal transducer with metallopeptidase domain
LAKNAGVHGEVALSTTDRLGSPAAIPGNEICLPRRVLAELTPLEQESLLAHELAHVIRRDTLWLQMGRLIESIAWFQPLNRVASRRMQLAAEFAADEWAVGMTNEPLRLAKCLARVAGWLTPRSTVLAPAMVESQGSPLVQRVRRLTAPVAVSHDGARVLKPAVLALAIAAVALVAFAPSIAVGHSAAEQNALFDIGDRQVSFIVMDGREASVDRRTLFTRRIDPRHTGVLRFVVAADGAGE